MKYVCVSVCLFVAVKGDHTNRGSTVPILSYFCSHRQESKPPPSDKLEEEEEEDSEAALRKAREWDDYKDGETRHTHTCTHTRTCTHAHAHTHTHTDHRRGWGNTKNIG